ncbi:MAG: hypothetical protein E7224_00025 [Clostridiales bacterium]|nr:hypothetical protein [Clostridiales bacterium]
MTYYDESLKGLYAKVARKKQLTAMLADLHAQKESLTLKTGELAAVSAKEQADVEKLEGGSLAAFFYGVVGKKNEKLDKEKSEAMMAAVKYDSAKKELDSVEGDILRYTEEFRALGECEKAYEEALAARLEEVKAETGPTAEKILELEKKIDDFEAQKRELDEAHAEGRIAREMAVKLWDKLDSAGGWATFDLLGGGLIADLAKHDHLQGAQTMVEELQVQLRRFKTELADVTITMEVQASVQGFLHIADYIFDGLIVDWMVADKIDKAQGQVWETEKQIRTTLKALETMKEAAEENQLRLKKEIENLVVG